MGFGLGFRVMGFGLGLRVKGWGCAVVVTERVFTVFTRFGRCEIFVLEKGIKGCEGICRV